MQGSWTARAFQDRKAGLLDVAVESFRRLQREADLVLIEGAGSPAETNLRVGDIANMGFACASGAPVLLVGDIDRGHVIAALVGAHAVLEAGDRAMIKGFLINKFRGDPSLFDDGRREIIRRTGWQDLGMAPWLAAARMLPAEDAVVLDGVDAAPSTGRPRIVVPLLRSLSNFDDFDPLRADPGVDFEFVPPGKPLPGDAHLVVLPGSKATLADLTMLRAEGWDIDLKAHVRRGGRVLGICGGYQMLGRRIADPQGLEGAAGAADGLGLLDVETVLTETKILQPSAGHLAESGRPFGGYEMHVGVTTGPGLDRPFLIHGDGRSDGAISADGRVAGTYVHGLFDRGEARAALLADLGAVAAPGDHAQRVDSLLDEIAEVLARSLDIDAIARIAGL
jgi:adenosylcobyric acid synthase